MAVTVESVSPTSPLGAATIEVRYDPAALRATACSIDPNAAFNSSLCNPTFDSDGILPDAVRFSVASIAGVSGNILLAQITFQDVGCPAAASILSPVISVFAAPDGGPIRVNSAAGAVTCFRAA